MGLLRFVFVAGFREGNLVIKTLRPRFHEHSARIL